MTAAPSLTIIIVNWNAGEQLRACVASIAESSRSRHAFTLDAVVIVDNASTDRSLDGLDGFGVPVRIERNATNRGFAAACNQGARGVSSSYLLFLNPDTRVSAESLSRPIAFLEDAANRGVVVASIQLVDDTGRVSRTCARFPTPAMFANHMVGLDRVWPRRFPSHFMATWDHAETRAVDHVIGAFYLVRRAAFEAVGGFDEAYFVYLEDLDLSRRLIRAGGRIVYLADARAYHRGGGTSEQVKAARLAYALHSRLRFGYKHFTPFAATALAAGTLALEPLVRVVHALARGRVGEAREVGAAFRLLWLAVLRGGL